MYFPVPKNACSSIKNTLWVVNNGSEFSPFTREGKEIRNIHQIYVSMRFSLDVLAENVPNWREYFRFRSEEHTSELQSLMRISYAVFCLKKKTYQKIILCQEIT